MKNLIKNTCFLLVFFSIFIACDNNSETDDYRYKYAGSYDFVTIKRSFSMAGYISNYESVSYPGRVSFSDTLEMDEMVIHYLENKSLVITVDELGIISEPGNIYTSGEFSGDSAVNLFYRWGGLGEGGNQSVEGKKR